MSKVSATTAATMKYEFTLGIPFAGEGASMLASDLDEALAATVTASLQKFVVPAYPSLVPIATWSRIIVDALTTTTTVSSTTTTVTKTTITATTVTTLKPTSTPTTSAPTSGPTPSPSGSPTISTTAPLVTSTSADANSTLLGADGENNVGAGSNGEWTRQDSIHLMIALLLTTIIMLIGFNIVYIRLSRQNLKFEHGRGGLENDAYATSSNANGNDGWNWQSQVEGGENPLSSHFYPASNQTSAADDVWNVKH
jgi:hypothetical protein